MKKTERPTDSLPAARRASITAVSALLLGHDTVPSLEGLQDLTSALQMRATAERYDMPTLSAGCCGE
jgi:hypothetical protein